MARKARLNKGKVCLFKGFRSDAWQHGVIIAVLVESRRNEVFYKIVVEGKKKPVKKRVASRDFMIDEEATQEKLRRDYLKRVDARVRRKAQEHLSEMLRKC